jgi:hypothetical protein
MAQAEKEWFVRSGTVVCSTPFNMREAMAATKRGDAQWLQQTGCERVLNGSQILIVEEPPLSSNRPWRVRLLDAGQTVYVHSAFIMGYADIKGKRIGPLSYHEVPAYHRHSAGY